MKLWGGRFKKEIDATFARFNASFSFDVRLLNEDIEGSMAYAQALRRAGVLTESEAAAINEGLVEIRRRAAEDLNYLKTDAEDVHSFVEARLAELVGDLAFKLHTGRSRNEQVAVDMRLFLMRETRQAQRGLCDVLQALLTLANANADVIIPGYTHMQKAQPIPFAHYLLAYYEMFKRDFDRLEDSYRRTDECPLGCGAIAGTSYAIDREQLAKDLGFRHSARNSLDAVSNRDFITEFIFAASLIMVHLSRLAEDLILYATTEFGFITLSDTVSTGSSLMPQKKNPDALELLRGKSGRVIGDLMAMLTLLKGLPTAYNKDLQEDKEPLFDAVDTVKEALAVTAIVLDNIELRKDALGDALKTGYLNATDLADYLVRKGMAFRKAHELVGKIVLYALERGLALQELTLEDFRSFSLLFDADVHSDLAIEASVARKAQPGGTAPEQVASALKRAEREVSELRSRLC